MLTDKPLLQDAGRIVPRLGPRLLVRPGQGQHLRQALRLAARRTALRLRPQVHLLAHRLQPEADRHAGGRGRGATCRSLPAFIEARRRNFARLHEGLRDLEEFFILPEATPGSEPSWFGFPIAVRAGAPFTRNRGDRAIWNERKIATRLLFGGNLLRQPAYRDVAASRGRRLANTDFVMNQVFWIGVYPGITPPMLDYMLETLARDCVGRAPARYG